MLQSQCSRRTCGMARTATLMLVPLFPNASLFRCSPYSRCCPFSNGASPRLILVRIQKVQRRFNALCEMGRVLHAAFDFLVQRLRDLQTALRFCAQRSPQLHHASLSRQCQCTPARVPLERAGGAAEPLLWPAYRRGMARQEQPRRML
jgi:hypothetical protein